MSEAKWFVIVTDDHGDEELWRRDLDGDDLISCDHWAQEYGRIHDISVDGGDSRKGYIPLGCADITVTIKSDQMGSATVWESQSYFTLPAQG